MKETTLEIAAKAAEDAAANGKSWHFHLLSPTCMFNKRNTHHALVVEIISDNETYVAYSDERPLALGQKLVGLLHGKKILDGKGDSNSANQNVAAQIVERAKDLNARGVRWHHHMLFPQCMLNSNRGHWSIVFEDPETYKILNALYEAEPVEDLKEIEALFYAQRS